MKVTVAKALKEKSRLAGRIRNLMQVVAKENSKTEGSTRTVDVRKVYGDVRQLMERLITIKGRIAEANNSVVAKIVELEEAKSMISLLGQIDTDDSLKYDYRVERGIKMTAVLSKSEVMMEIDALQERANRLQDELDEFNVREKIEIEFN